MSRNIPAKIRDIQPDAATQEGQEIKVCVRTYRLFFVSEKEDFLWKFRSKEEMEEAAANLMKRNVLRKQWLEKSRTIPVVVPKPVTDKTPIPLASTSSNIAEPPAVTEVESEAVEGKNESIPPPPQPPVDETTTV